MRENQRNMPSGLPTPYPRNQPMNRTLKLSGMLFSPLGLPAQHAKTLRDPARPPRSEISELLDLSCSDDEATRKLPSLSQLRNLRPRQTSLPPKPQIPGFDDSDSTDVMAPHELPDFASPPLVPRLNGLPDLSPPRDTPPDLLAWSQPRQPVPVAPPPPPESLLQRFRQHRLTPLDIAVGVVALFAIAFLAGSGLLAATESTRFVPHAAVPVDKDGVPIGTQAAPAPTYQAPGAVLVPEPDPIGQVLSLDDLPLVEAEPAADDAAKDTKAKTKRRSSRVWKARVKSPRRGLQRPIPAEWKSAKAKNAKP